MAGGEWTEPGKLSASASQLHCADLIKMQTWLCRSGVRPETLHAPRWCQNCWSAGPFRGLIQVKVNEGLNWERVHIEIQEIFLLQWR